VFRRIRRLGYPCFVKPACTGSSIGISRVTNKRELDTAIETALMYDDKVIVEKAVSGRELECAVIGSCDDAEASIVGEIMPAGGFYDFESKYNNKTSQTIVPADVPEHVSEEIRELSVKIFKVLDCHGLARVDFFWDEQAGKVIFNEINTMPGFTSISMYPMLWNEMGISTPELIDRLIKLATG
jgi:D-alanine-D-alanine ligase